MTRPALTLLAAAFFAVPALAEHKHPEAHRHQQVAAAASHSAALTAGEVRKVDRDSGEIILKHARIRSMDMPAMTMPFSVRDNALFDQLKAGDRIRFAAEIINDRPTITRIVR